MGDVNLRTNKMKENESYTIRKGKKKHNNPTTCEKIIMGISHAKLKLSSNSWAIS
jgi:hypothetical protein